MDKENPKRDLQIELGKLIDRDLEFLTKSQGRAPGSGQRAKRSRPEDEVSFGDQEIFARLLANVATHSMGSEASAMPLSESPESMLAYLMDLFQLNQDEMEGLLLGDAKDRAEKLQSNMEPRKHYSYSFSPELRLRLNPLVIPRAEDLIVEVHLIDEEAPKQTSRISTVTSEGSKESRGISEVLRMRGSSNSSPQSVNSKLLAEIKFLKREDGHEPEVTCLNHNFASTSNLDASELQIRLHPSQRKSSSQVVQFDFKFSQGSNATSKGRFLRLNFCCCGHRKSSKTTNLPAYGSTRIKVNQIPAYAAKLNQSITTALDQLVDNCETISELKNSDQNRGSSSHEDTLNHARLYSICIAYQLKTLNRNDISTSPSYFRTNQANRASSNLDSVLGSPALSLINQHRLQSNISQLEDQSLRRSAVLLLLTRMARFKDVKSYSKSHRIFLAHIVEHEYLGAHRHFNNTTRQEVDPFHSGLEFDNSHDQVKMLEYTAIQNATSTFLCEPHIKDWISNADSLSSKPRDMEFLVDLSLVRTILSHNENNACVDPRFKNQSTQLKIHINQMMTKVLTDELQSRLNTVLTASNTTREERQNKRKGIKQKLGNNEKLEQNAQYNPWRKLFCDIQMIENDITLHWSDRGLEFVKLDRTKLSPIKEDGKKLSVLSNIIQNKISNYLTNK